jgi:hypothetical protein
VPSLDSHLHETLLFVLLATGSDEEFHMPPPQNPIQQVGVVSGRVGLGVASAVNKAFTSLETSIETIPSVFIGDEAGDNGGNKKKSEEKKTKAEEQRKKDAAAKKAADDAKAAKAAEDKKRKEKDAALEAKKRESKAEEAAAAAAKKAEEQRRRESSAKMTVAKQRERDAAQRAQEESKRRAEKEAEKEEARKQRAREDAKRAYDAAKAKKSKRGKEKAGATFGVEGLDMLLSASSTRVSISVAILAILTSYFHARRHATTVKHRKVRERWRDR